MMHYLADAVPIPDMPEGTCVGTDFPDAWHADIHRESKARRVATYLCHQCVEIRKCGGYALRPENEDITGVWGGMSEKDRIEIRAGRKKPPWEQPQKRA
jgi:hypothetical protein